MNKITLVSNIGDFSSFSSTHLSTILSDYFNCELFDPTKTYNKSRTIFVTNCVNQSQDWYLPYYLDGYKLLIDALWERPPIKTSLENTKIISNENWFWYNESIWYEYLNYNNYVPNWEYKKLGLLLMRKKMPVRTKLIDSLSTVLDKFVYSYTGNGIFLDNDLIINGDVEQRYFNPEWYNQTCFSLVAETNLTGAVFITEKTFKPIAFNHPYMIFGQSGTLARLKSLGFETYNNLFDESYDTETSVTVKISKLIDNVLHYDNIPHNKLTVEKIQHNHNLFFNKELVLTRFKKEIIEPVLEYAET